MASSLGATVNVARTGGVGGCFGEGKRVTEEKLMPGKMALIDFAKCHPEQCDSGVCVAVAACTHKLLKQEALYEMPMTDPAICQGCGDCVRACPLKALKIVRM